MVMHFNSRDYYQREYGNPEYMEEGWFLSAAYPDLLPECSWVNVTHWMPIHRPHQEQQ